MKTPLFWYPHKNNLVAALLSGVLSPLSCVFRAGTALRRATATSYRSHIPVICVGNVVAGGAGKTPTALALARLLWRKGHKPVFVTRGYGGQGNLICVDPAIHTTKDVGDEALLLAAIAPTWASLDRAEAIRQAERNGSVIIMVDGEVGIGNGHIIPAGPLRESFADALKRVAAVIIIGENDKQNLATKTGDTPVFRAHLKPVLPSGFPRHGKFVAFAGIARPQKFYTTALNFGLDVVATQDFPDHHPFTEADIDGLRLTAEEQGARLLTTEKDVVRLPANFRDEVVVLPVTLTFNEPNAEDRLSRLLFT